MCGFVAVYYTEVPVTSTMRVCVGICAVDIADI